MADELVEKYAQQHSQQSLAEMSDPRKVERWHDGTRASEAADQITSALIVWAEELLQTGGTEQ